MAVEPSFWQPAYFTRGTDFVNLAVRDSLASLDANVVMSFAPFVGVTVGISSARFAAFGIPIGVDPPASSLRTAPTCPSDHVAAVDAPISIQRTHMGKGALIIARAFVGCGILVERKVPVHQRGGDVPTDHLLTRDEIEMGLHR